MSKYFLTTMAVMALVAAQMSAMAVETKLAGVKLGITTSQQLVSRLGNPTMVQVNDGRTGTGSGTAGAAAGMSSMGGSSMALLGGMQSAVQGYAGALNSAMGGGAPTMPGMSMPGMSMPGMGGMPGMGSSSMPGMGGSQQRGTSDMQQPGAEVLMIYETSGHKMRYEFLFNRLGKLKQISVYGFKDLRGLKTRASAITSQGIGIGSSFNQVVKKYGMPSSGVYGKSSNKAQNTITFVYLDKHLAIQFVKNSVVALVVCLDPPTKYTFESPGYSSGQAPVAQGGMGSTMPGMGAMSGGSSMPSMPGMMSPGMSGGGASSPMMPPGMGIGGGGMSMPPSPNIGR